jgi:GH24 family phage-related lysozyme (muramidase)
LISKNIYVDVKNIKINGFELSTKSVLNESEINALISTSPNQYKLCLSLCYYAGLRFFETKKLEKIINQKDISTEMPSYVKFSRWLKQECLDKYDKHITTHCLRTSNAIHLYQKTFMT